jgi:N-acetylglucosamine kinase-like BadF-type ATPase
MMIIADSGSTKTDWSLVSNDGHAEGTITIGLNPHLISENDFTAAFQDSKLSEWAKLDVRHIYFYGAGITGQNLQEKIAKSLNSYFEEAKISVESDLLAAARAAYGNNQGVIGILGTGSNCGYYDGRKIEKNIPPLGYILGDEGSGNALGRRLLTLFLRSELSDEISNSFEVFYPEHASLLSKVYSLQQVSPFLASFVPFIHDHLSDKGIHKMVKQELRKYFELLEWYSSISDVALVGSVAYYFSEMIEEIADEKGLKLGAILKSPIDALTLYHQVKS